MPTFTPEDIMAAALEQQQQAQQTEPLPKPQVKVEKQTDLDPVVSEALGYLGSAFPTPPRIYAIDEKTAQYQQMPNKQAPAFRRMIANTADPNIYVNKKSDAYNFAAGGDKAAMRILAGILAHEMTHANSGTQDEGPPSQAELNLIDTFLEDPALTDAERAELLNRRETVIQYGKLKPPKAPKKK
ncbi:MAG: hypothetical protein ACOYD0_11885 [Candidatus Nanopelagicales bacterium]